MVNETDKRAGKEIKRGINGEVEGDGSGKSRENTGEARNEDVNMGK